MTIDHGQGARRRLPRTLCRRRPPAAPPKAAESARARAFRVHLGQTVPGGLRSVHELACLPRSVRERRACHDINFVRPEHVVPEILEALLHAIDSGVRLRVVYNTSAYDSMERLRWMDGVVDIYMPDFKYWSSESAARILKARDYPDVARRTIAEMHRQVGPLAFDAEGLARRGLLVRHLVMPGALEETREILAWVARELGPDTYVNVMDQYRPEGR